MPRGLVDYLSKGRQAPRDRCLASLAGTPMKTKQHSPGPPMTLSNMREQPMLHLIGFFRTAKR
jgi:hypothetical protein